MRVLRAGGVAGLVQFRAACLALLIVSNCAAAAGALSPDSVGRILAGLESSPQGLPISSAELAQYAHNAAARWKQYEARIGAPMQRWAESELAPAPGGTVFYPFAGPDFATVQRLYPRAQRYVLVALQRAEAPPVLEHSTAADLSAFLGRFSDAWKQFAQIGFFRTVDLDEEAKQPGLRAGTIVPLLAFAVRSGYRVSSVEPMRVNASGSDLEVHPGPRTDAATWNSVRMVLERESRVVVLDYVRMNLADSVLAARPEARAWIATMAAHRTVLKAASHLLQSPRFGIVRDALLEHAPSIVQDETGLDYASLLKDFDVKLYGRFSRPHRLFDQNAQRALAAAYQSEQEIKPLAFRVSYQRQEANLQVATRSRLLSTVHKP
ncbi:MAG: hypothetical protein IT531_09860 [Burkholderiales bacterium]|nr:hypothetical protein [Burkholderiales bacterium]